MKVVRGVVVVEEDGGGRGGRSRAPSGRCRGSIWLGHVGGGVSVGWWEGSLMDLEWAVSDSMCVVCLSQRQAISGEPYDRRDIALLRRRRQATCSKFANALHPMSNHL